MATQTEIIFDLKELLSHIKCPKYEQIITNYFENGSYLETNVAKKEQQAVTWLSWAQQNDKLKIVGACIPDGILPDGLNGSLEDIKVFTKYGPDDDIYDNNKDIRDKVARGNCFLKLVDGKLERVECVIYALKKFTGGLGDDDDRQKGDNNTWKCYFTKPLDCAQRIIATQKANGEAAHLSARYIAGSYIIFAGSKNVHLAVRNKEDIDLYTEDRYRVAREVTHAVMNALEEFDDETRLRLLRFLCHTEYTAVFEILNPAHQHVEDLSHLKKPMLRFITWTSNDLEANDSSLCGFPPDIAIEVAKALGLITVEYEIISVTDFEDRMKSVRKGYGYEGEVFYFLDAESCVIGLLKKKTVWYILARSIREKVRNACAQKTKNSNNYTLGGTINKIEKRIGEIQQWLGLDSETTSHWKTLGSSFMKWCVHQMDSGDVTLHDISDLFPVTWNRFLTENDFTDKIEATCTDDLKT